MQTLSRALIVACAVALILVPASAEAKGGSRGAWAHNEKLRTCGVDYNECNNAFVWTGDGLYLVPHDMTMKEVYLSGSDHIAKQGSPSWFVLGLAWLISRYWFLVAVLALAYVAVNKLRRNRSLAST